VSWAHSDVADGSREAEAVGFHAVAEVGTPVVDPIVAVLLIGAIEDVERAEGAAGLEAGLDAGLPGFADLEGQGIGDKIGVEDAKGNVELAGVDGPGAVGWHHADDGRIHFQVRVVLFVEQGDLAGDPVVHLGRDADLRGG
jgi:hypothetical protein